MPPCAASLGTEGGSFMSDKDVVEKAKEHFGKLVTEQLARIERMKAAGDWIDYASLKPIIVGVLGGDGIGPSIAAESRRVLQFVLRDQLASGKIEMRDIEGLTIERRAAEGKAIPTDVVAEIEKCHVLLKGPTTTPRKGDPWPNVESANVAMRRQLDLFANVRPVRVPKEGIDWIFFRENTEGAYVLGSKGVNVNEDLAFDFTVATTQGTERLIRLAFDHAHKNRIPKLTLVSKANVVKTTDGKFLEIGYRVAKEYPDIEVDDWYIDIMTAKLVDPKRRSQFRVVVLPNLYGDILTDEAAEFQGGVGTAGSGNIGKRYAMYEAIHGSAPRMVQEGRAQYADPSSMVRAAAFLVGHIGYPRLSRRLELALDICGQFERKIEMTGRSTGATGSEFCDYILDTLKSTDHEDRWARYQK
jgi:isocitrate dehydrogenase (NAD+)